MGLRSAPMTRVVLVGLKEDRDRILSYLHDHGVIQVESLGKEGLKEFAPDHPGGEQREVLEQQSRVRALVQALPPVPVTLRQRFENVAALLAAARAVPIDEEVRQLKRREDQLITELKAAEDELRLVEDYAFFPGDLGLLRARSLVSYFGEATLEAFAAFEEELRQAAPDRLLFQGGGDPRVRFVLSLPRERAEAATRAAQRLSVRLVPVPETLSGTATALAPEVRARRDERMRELAKVREELARLAARWVPVLLPLEEQLDVEARKAELISRMGSSREAFALEGWMPKDRVDRLARGLEELTGGRTILFPVRSEEAPPTLLRNRRGPRAFEFFIRFYSFPQSAELDPTLVFAIVFPIFFGVMLGDVGYGAVILAVCLWIIWRVGNPRAGRTLIPRSLVRFTSMIMPPSAMKQLAKALIPGCLVAIGLGVLFDEYFGFSLAQLTFGHFNFQLFDPVSSSGVAKLLLYAGYTGLAMVSLGFLFGVVNALTEGHRREAIAKGLWLVLAWDIALAGLALLHKQITIDPAATPLTGVFLGVAVALILGVAAVEGGQGAIEVMSLVSHILSYTRLVGILLASVILAEVINKIALGLFHNALLLVAGVAILVIGQGFNIVLGVFEPGIQGARLIYVEYFSKFYHGGGRIFRPFGGPRRYTEPQFPPHAPAPPPAGQVPGA